jgi:hypothetical protein
LTDVMPPDNEWNYQNGDANVPTPTPPPPQRRHRRGLLDWLFNWGDDDEDSDDNSGNNSGRNSGHDSNGRRHRSDNSDRELAPRAVQQGDGHWTRVPGQGSRPRPNYPPANAAVPPPDQPPPSPDD